MFVSGRAKESLEKRTKLVGMEMGVESALLSYLK
jgi:hypothetical protein